MKKFFSRILFLLIFSFIGIPGVFGVPLCEASIHLAPVFVYESFERDAPEPADADRFGAGLYLGIDLGTPVLVLESQGLFLYEKTTFASDNTYQENTYQLREGLLWRFLNPDPFHLGVRGGVQYDRGMGQYVLTLPDETIAQDHNFWTEYGGLQLEIIPASGIGLQLGATEYYDHELTKWITEYTLGIVFHTP